MVIDMWQIVFYNIIYETAQISLSGDRLQLKELFPVEIVDVDVQGMTHQIQILDPHFHARDQSVSLAVQKIIGSHGIMIGKRHKIHPHFPSVSSDL